MRKAAPGFLDENFQLCNGSAVNRSHALEGLAQTDPRGIEQAVGLLQCGDFRNRKTATLQPDAVEAAGPRRTALGNAERQSVLGNPGKAADHGVAADAAELVHAHPSRDEGAIAHHDLPRQVGAVDDDHVIADLTVVGDMAVRHEKTARAHTRGAPGPGTAVDGDAFPDRIVVADLGRAVAIPELEVLRITADHGVLGDAVARSHPRAALDHRVAGDPATIADNSIVLDDHVGAHEDAIAKPGAGGD